MWSALCEAGGWRCGSRAERLVWRLAPIALDLCREQVSSAQLARRLGCERGYRRELIKRMTSRLAEQLALIEGVSSAGPLWWLWQPLLWWLLRRIAARLADWLLSSDPAAEEFQARLLDPPPAAPSRGPAAVEEV